MTIDHRHHLYIPEELKSCQEKNNNDYWICADFLEFRLINYRYGNAIGDFILKEVEVYFKNIPEIKYIHRLFSDQFAAYAIMDEDNSEERITEMFQEYIEAFVAKYQTKVPECQLRICAGICKVDHFTMEEAIDNAYAACKKVRMSRQSGIGFYREKILKQQMQDHATELALTKALEQEQFTFYLQPQVNVTNNDITGAEALVRMIDENGHVVQPGQFIPYMERNGLIIDIDFLVLRQVCKSLKERFDQGKRIVRISVNFSRLHIFNKETAKKIYEIVTAYQISPDYIEIELTETVILENINRVKYLIDELRKYGFCVAIDDYGTGQTGMTFCREIDFDVLKLDSSLFSDREKIKKINQRMIPCIMQIAGDIGIKRIVCEGIENKERLDEVVQWGCKEIQGYYFSKPLTQKEFYSLIDDHDGKIMIAS